MRLDAFDYDLPEELIALRPARPRPASRLLVATAGRIADSTVARLPDWLERGDLLVLNDTRVIPARLAGVRRRASGGEARIEATLIAHGADGAWRALARPGKRLAVGDRIEFGGGLARGGAGQGRGRGAARLRPRRRGADGGAGGGRRDAAAALYRGAAAGGRRRPARTIRRSSPRGPGRWRRRPRRCTSTRRCWTTLAARGVARTFVTLHVGAGTFLPVKVAEIEAHRMHSRMGRDRRRRRRGDRGDPGRGRAGGAGRHHGAAADRDRRDRAAPDRALDAARPTSSSGRATGSASPTG